MRRTSWFVRCVTVWRGWVGLLAWGLAADTLMNLDFGTGTISQKSGPAAVGQSASDFWNLYTRDDGQGGFRTYGELNGLKWSDQSPSTVNVAVVNAPGAWGTGSADPMFGTYLYPISRQGNIGVTFTGVPAGHYDLYVYGHGITETENGVYQVTSAGVDYPDQSTQVGLAWGASGWLEGVHYVAFRNLGVAAGEPLVVTAKPGQSGLSVINGLQLVQKDTVPPEVVLHPGRMLTRVAAGPVVQHTAQSLGGAWGDYDGDGDADLFVVNYDQPCELFRNEGNGSFTVVAAPESAAVTTTGATSASWVDYDNNGTLDLLVTYYGTQRAALWRNEGNGTFALHEGAGIESLGAECYGAAWADYDNDGWADVLLFKVGGPNLLYRNQRNGTFGRAEAGALTQDSGATVGGAWGDYDNDGWRDVYVARGAGQSGVLYHNEGNGTFRRISSGSIVSDGGESESAAWGDYDNDGDLDLYVANRVGVDFLYRNEGGGNFTRIMEGDIATLGGESNGCGWADIDADGWLDLVVANYQGGQNYLYRNNQNGTFTRVTTGAVPTDPGNAVGLAWGDSDGNGFPDLFVANWVGNNFLYQNVGNENRWLRVRCVGTKSNRSGLGAVVRVKPAGSDRAQMRVIAGAQGWTDHGLEALFGLGAAAKADWVTVEWPSGAVQQLGSVAAGQTLTLTEPDPLVVFTPNGGTFSQSVDVVVTTSFGEGEIRFTVDGSEPGPSSTLYQQPLRFEQTTVLRAIVVFEGEVVSPVFTRLFSLRPPTVVVPNPFAQVEDQDGSSGVLTIPIRLQDVYGAAHLPPFPILIHAIRFRPDAGVAIPAGASANVEVRLSTTPRAPEALSAIFAENTGPDEVVGFQGVLTLAGAAATPPGPAPFLIEIPLAVPFLYNPTVGNLLVDLKVTNPVQMPWNDASNETTDQASRVYSTDPTAATATVLDTGADILELMYSEKVPSIWMLPAGGAYDRSLDVQCFSGVAGAVIHYTTDGSEPTVASARYLQPVHLKESATFKARAFVGEAVASEILTAQYAITLTPPVIGNKLADYSHMEGVELVLGVQVTGSLPFTYAWFKDDVLLPAATSSNLTLKPLQMSDAGLYSVRVTNDAGSASAAIVRITVLPRPVRPTIKVQPVAQTAVVGSKVTFSVVAEGTEPLTYEWRRAGIIVGAGSPMLTIESVQSGHAGNYSVRVSNVAGAVTSASAALKVVTAPVAPRILAQPQGKSATAGSSFLVSVAVDGTIPLTFQWFRSGARLTQGAAGQTLYLDNVGPAQAGTYYVVVSNPAGQVTSVPAIVDVDAGEVGGKVLFANRAPAVSGPELDAPVFDDDGTTRLTGLSYFAQLYAGPSADQLQPIGAAVPFGLGVQAGYWLPRATSRTIPTVSAGADAAVQVCVWEGAAGGSYEAAFANGGKTGRSEVFTVTTGGGSPDALPAVLTPLKSFRVARETILPVVHIESPVTGTVRDERAVLKGTVADNASVASARWERDGTAMGHLALAEGRFEIPVTLHRGENQIRVIARDHAGNEAAGETVVVWNPLRTLLLSSAGPQQEGRYVFQELKLQSEGIVMGLSFVIHYQPDWLMEPSLVWAPELASGIRQVNYDTPGEIRATLAPSAPFSAEPQTLASISFRARSVPALTEVQVPVEVMDVSDILGNKLVFGTDVEAGKVVITPRLLLGDANGNDRLDVGDATVVQRFLVRLETPRAWDTTGADLNQSRDLDSGDVVKIMRVAVGLDAPPQAPGGGAAAGSTDMNTGWTDPAEAALLNIPRLPPRVEGEWGPPQPIGWHMDGGQGSGTAEGAFVLSADRLRAAAGERITVQVRLEGLKRAVAGAAFHVTYPATALRLVESGGVRPGSAVPADAVALWNVVKHDGTPMGELVAAMSGVSPWTAASGVVAELAFEVQAGASIATAWPIVLSEGEVSSPSGLDLMSLPASALSLNPPPEFQAGPSWVGEGLRVVFTGLDGLEYTIEASTDLNQWSGVGTRLCQGGVVEFVDPAALTLGHRFYRVREGR